MITIIDYGMGNLRSVQKAVEKVGFEAVISQNPQDIERASKIILPGVGAMKPAMKRLTELKLVSPIKKFIKTKKPFLGICLGLQLLFERSDEGGNTLGLGILPGQVKKFTLGKIPHMGWNQLIIKNSKNALLKGINDKAFVYFCHSYYINPKDKKIIATKTDYEEKFTSSISVKNIYGVQFHPEKSQDIGLQILKNFVSL